MRFMHKPNVVILLGIFLFVPFFVSAQLSTTTAVQPTSDLQQQIDQLVQDRMNAIPKIEDIRAKSIKDYLEVTTLPKNPGPSEMVQVSLQSYLTDLNKALITWSLNGKIIKSGRGEWSLSFQNGPSGKTTRLTISIVANTGETITKELSWNPVGLTILWEADTYTPPFYRGKALLSPQAAVRAVAIPDDTGGQNALNAGNLVYVWEKDGTTATNASGYGKNSFLFRAPKPYEDANVKVRASSINNTINSETKINLTLTNPFILFYEKHPLLGVWYNRPFGTDINLNKKEISISAEPYFFSNEASSEIATLKYDWLVNGNPTQNFGHIITLRNDTGANGSSSLSLSMYGIRQTFQFASQSLMVHFTAEDIPANSLF